MNTDPKTPSTQQEQQGPVSVRVGGSEGAPARVETPAQATESYIESSDAEPQIHPEVASAGVKAVPQQPKIHADAQAAGVKPSIPDGPVYGNLPTDQNIATNTFKSGDSGISNTWRALLAIKELARGLFGSKKPQEVS